MAPKNAKQGKAKEAAKALGWRINIHSSVAVYVQIENMIKFALSAGKLGYSDQLPSVRELCEKLDVNPNTVAKAYRDLEVMGLLYTRRGMGVYVAKNAQSDAAKTVGREISSRIAEVAREAGAAGFDQGGVASQVKDNMKLGAAGKPIYT